MNVVLTDNLSSVTQPGLSVGNVANAGGNVRAIGI